MKKEYTEPVVDLDSGEITPPKPSSRKYPNAPTVFKLFGKHPANWKINRTQLQSAENLFAERGINQITKALAFYKEHREEKYCPNINSPYDLDSKWAKIIGFQKRL